MRGATFFELAVVPRSSRMRWTHLGHAMWLAEAAGLRLLFDPLLAPTHHGGVYQTVPRRELDVRALRPDVILVSHRHPDHFDVASLHRLAAHDATARFITPDPLVAWAARELGFRQVECLVAPESLALAGVTLVATPSLGRDEWGMLVASERGVVWNQVDTVLRDVAAVRSVVADALQRVGRSRIDLALVRWQPMHEIAAQLGHSVAFPYDAYEMLLAQISAVGARAVVPSACGGSHTASFRYMDQIFCPVSPDRFLADIARFDPDLDAFPASLGGVYEIVDGEIEFEPRGDSDLVVSADDEPDPRRYRPVELPPVRDPNPGGHDEGITRPRVRAFIHDELAPALHRQVPAFDVEGPLRFVVEVPWSSVTDAYTITVDHEGARVVAEGDPEWDALVVVAGSLLWEVIEGRRNWGDVLLAGALRGYTRAYTPFNGKLLRAPVAPTFLYYALPYDRSVERAVRWEVEQLSRS